MSSPIKVGEILQEEEKSKDQDESWFSLFSSTEAIANAITICMGKVIEQARSASEMLPCPFTCFTLYPSTVASSLPVLLATLVLQAIQMTFTTRCRSSLYLVEAKVRRRKR